MMLKHCIAVSIIGCLLFVSATAETNPCQGVNSGFKPHESDCTKYYSCVNGVAHLLQCPTKYPIFQNGKCDYGDPAYCVNCPSEGVARFPIPYSCSQFILCVNGVQSRGRCPDGLIFDRTLQQCNLIANAPKCVDVECPAQNTETPTFRPHPTECSVYFICVDGDPVRQECPAGTAFNPVTETCDRKENVQCPAFMRSVVAFLSLVQSKTIRSNEKCVGNTGIKNLPDPDDCSRYYMCMKDQQFLVPCGSGKVFDTKSLKCNKPENSVCIRDVTDQVSPCKGNLGLKFVPHSKDCTKYFMCMSDKEYEVACSASKHFDVTTSKCQDITKAKCFSEDTLEPQVKPVKPVNPCVGNVGTVRVPDPAECSSFYTCTDEMAFHQHCSSSLIFDALTRKCNRPENSVCIIDVAVAPTIGPVTATETVSTPSTSTISNLADPSTPACLKAELFYHPHRDCNKFYRCVYGTLHVLDCPDNQHWNQAREFCDHVWNAKCVSRRQH
ncbi:probable chitinase 10 [Malaya genurostris]|uniref:probable chitinase 10 n=1 Tax=Malaya genurostris TaxID=325434 RepID=UPI0026F3988C|nr:probable chitinase 10 [Malaya genurostris]